MSSSGQMHRSFREASDRFDQFVLGALLAICAYLAQSNSYARIGCNAETVLFLSLLFFVASAFFGFKRIEQVIVLYRINADYLHAVETKDAVTTKQALELKPNIGEKAISYYRWRNRFMFIGLAAYVLAKYWHAYS